MTLYDAPSIGAVDPSGFIAADIPCRQCAYNQRGLHFHGRCPECGTPVAVSVHGDLLRFSRPDWLLTLRRGVNLIIGGVALMILGVVLGAVFAANRSAATIALVGIISFAAYACGLAGSWLLTTPDPSGIGEDKYGTARRIIRVTLIVGLANSVLEQTPRVIDLPSGAFTLLQLISALAGIVSIVGFVAELAYLSKLAMRIPDLKLSGRARFLMFAIGISYGIIAATGLIVVLATLGSASPSPFAALGCVMVFPGLALLVFGIMYLLLLERMGKAFKLQAGLAADHWAQLSQPPTPPAYPPQQV